MSLLLSLVDGLVGIVASFLGAMNTTQLAAVGAVARRWLSRVGLALWPDVREPDDPEPDGAQPRGLRPARRRRGPRAR